MKVSFYDFWRIPANFDKSEKNLGSQMKEEEDCSRFENDFVAKKVKATKNKMS